MDITQDPEYIRGYNAYLEHNKKLEERRKTPYMQGFLAASKELLHRDALAIEAEMESDGVEFQDNTIKKLQQEIKALDERLAKLERYVKE